MGNWNNTNNSLQALALSPRSETPESRSDSRSPGTTPRDSPRISRKTQHIQHQQEINLRLGLHHHHHHQFHHPHIQQHPPQNHRRSPLLQQQTKPDIPSKTSSSTNLGDLGGDHILFLDTSRSVTPGVASSSTSGIGSSASSSSGSGGTVAIGPGGSLSTSSLLSAASMASGMTSSSPTGSSGSNLNNIPIIPPPLPPRKTSPSRKGVRVVVQETNISRVEVQKSDNPTIPQPPLSESSSGTQNGSSENGYDVPSTLKPEPTPSTSTFSPVTAIPGSSSSAQQPPPPNARPLPSTSHVICGRPLNVNKALELIHQQQQQLRHQSCPLLAAASGGSPLPPHLSTPKSCPSSSIASPICQQQGSQPSNNPSSKPIHLKTANCLALSSITSCCVMSTGPLLPRHSLHPQQSGKTPSSSFSTRVVANKSGSSSSSSSSVTQPSRKPLSANSNEKSSTNENHKGILGISFKSFPIPVKMPAVEPSEGPNYENTNISSHSNHHLIKFHPPNALQLQQSKEVKILPDLENDNPMAPYENLNMDYISTLTNEGFTQDLVIRALGISRNDIEMAREILTEFAGSHS